MVKANEVSVRLDNADIVEVQKALEGFTILDLSAYGIGGYEDKFTNQKGEVTEEEVKAEPVEEVEPEIEVEEKEEKVFDEVEDIEEEKPKVVKKAEAEAVDYDSMTMAELRDEIELRGLDTKSVKKQPLVDALIEDDKGETSEEIDEADETEENVGSKYEGRKAMDLFKEAKDRGLKVKPRQKAAFYVEALEELDAKELAEKDKVDDVEEVWEDVDEDEDEWDI